MEKKDIKTFKDILAWTIELREQMAEVNKQIAEKEALEKIQREEERKQREEKAVLDQIQRDKEHKEAERKWQREMSKINKQIAEVTGSHGREAEHMFYRTLDRTRKIGNIKFDRMFCNVKPTKNSREYDIILTNGDYIALVEVKRTASKEDVLKLVNEQAKDFRNEMLEYKDKKMLCVLAAYTCIDEVVEFAKEMGVCVLLKNGVRIKEEVGTLKYF